MDELRRTYHHDLEAARGELARLAALVAELIPRATAVLLDGDLEGAEYIIRGDEDRRVVSTWKSSAFASLRCSRRWPPSCARWWPC